MIKRLFLLIILFLTAIRFLPAQCPEITLDTNDKILVSKLFNSKQSEIDKEFILSISASAKQTSWAIKGRESAVLTIFIDDKYVQDIILFGGAQKFKYQVLLGKISKGNHQFKIVLNTKKSASNSPKVSIYSTQIIPNRSKNSIDKIALENSPILYLRPETIGKFSDIPLLTYYEVLPKSESSYLIRYTTIFSNEDGGTQTAALLARWGRTTDIEWVYEIEISKNKIVSEQIQGVNHVTKYFEGKRLWGSHPAIYDASNNNNFADKGCSSLRTALVPQLVDLTRNSRETVMDANYWIYRIMAEEAAREGRIEPENLGVNSIADLRDYIYVEIYQEPKETAVSLKLKTDDGKIFTSDNGNSYHRVDRKGFSRIAMLFPRKFRNKMPINLSIFCHSKSNGNQSGACQNTNLIKVVTLKDDFSLKEFKTLGSSKNLTIGDKNDFKVKLN